MGSFYRETREEVERRKAERVLRKLKIYREVTTNDCDEIFLEDAHRVVDVEKEIEDKKRSQALKHKFI